MEKKQERFKERRQIRDDTDRRRRIDNNPEGIGVRSNAEIPFGYLRRTIDIQERRKDPDKEI